MRIRQFTSELHLHAALPKALSRLCLLACACGYCLGTGGRPNNDAAVTHSSRPQERTPTRVYYESFASTARA